MWVCLTLISEKCQTSVKHNHIATNRRRVASNEILLLSWYFSLQLLKLLRVNDIDFLLTHINVTFPWGFPQVTLRLITLVIICSSYFRKSHFFITLEFFVFFFWPETGFRSGIRFPSPAMPHTRVSTSWSQLHLVLTSTLRKELGWPPSGLEHGAAPASNPDHQKKKKRKCHWQFRWLGLVHSVLEESRRKTWRW